MSIIPIIGIAALGIAGIFLIMAALGHPPQEPG